MNTKNEEGMYLQGAQTAAGWIAAGGDLMVDPPRRGEAFENGFCDALALERFRVLKLPRFRTPEQQAKVVARSAGTPSMHVRPPVFAGQRLPESSPRTQRGLDASTAPLPTEK